MRCSLPISSMAGEVCETRPGEGAGKVGGGGGDGVLNVITMSKSGGRV